MVYAVLIVGALIVSLTMQAGTGMFNVSAIVSGVIRGALMAIGILTVNFALGLYEHPSTLTVGQVRARAVLSFFFSMAIAGGVLFILPLNFPYRNEQALVALLIMISGMLIIRLFGGDIFPASYTRQRVLIFGTGSRADVVGQSLQENDPNIELVGYFSSSTEKEPAVSALRVISSGQTLTDAVNKHRVDKIVVALSERRGGSMPMRELLDCKVNGIQVIDIATHFE